MATSCNCSLISSEIKAFDNNIEAVSTFGCKAAAARRWPCELYKHNGWKKERVLELIYIYIIYICLQVRDCMVMVLLKASMLEVPSAVAFVVQGLKSNFYGLGCPAYCTSPSVGSFLAFFLLGLVLGFVLCVWLILRFDLIPTVASTPFAGPCAPSSAHPPVVGRARSALLGYLHEPQPRRRH